jgi:hypothetical protein
LVGRSVTARQISGSISHSRKAIMPSA